MSYCIDIQDLAGNALIELIEKTGKRTRHLRTQRM